jgi:quinol-cytochrome oxidoreductase complex cytochrome b subunit
VRCFFYFYTKNLNLFIPMRTDQKKLRGSLWDQPVLTVVQNHLVRYPTPSNLNGNYNWGVLAGLCLVLQI